MKKKKKRVAAGDFVTRDDGTSGSWMITGIVFNYELNKYQARVIKVGNPSVVDFVEPETLTVIEKKF
jgi:hypothetical protein